MLALFCIYVCVCSSDIRLLTLKDTLHAIMKAQRLRCTPLTTSLINRLKVQRHESNYLSTHSNGTFVKLTLVTIYLRHMCSKKKCLLRSNCLLLFTDYSSIDIVSDLDARGHIYIVQVRLQRLSLSLYVSIEWLHFLRTASK